MRDFYNKLLYMNKIIYILWFQGLQVLKGEKYVRFSFLELCVLEPIS
jgi:hypothetical protein